MILALLLAVGPTVDAGFPKVLVRDNVAISDTVSAVFTTGGAVRTIVVCIGEESPTGNLTNTLAWTTATPSGAVAFPGAANVDASYDDAAGDDQIAKCWETTATSVLTGVSVTHHNTLGAGNIGVVMYIWSIAGASGSVGATGITTPSTPASLAQTVTVNATGTSSMVLGVVGTAITSAAQTANGVTTFDSSNSLPTVGSWYAAMRLTTNTTAPGNDTIGSATAQTFRVGAALEILNAGAAPTCVPSGPLLGVTAC